MKLRTIAAAALALAALAGCGDGDEDRPPAQPREEAEWVDPRAEEERRPGARTVEADPGGAQVFRPAELRAEAGRVTLELVNPSTTAHSLCVDSEAHGALGCTGTFRGDRSVLRLRLQLGSYTFFCSVPGHRDAGMRGTLTVE